MNKIFDRLFSTTFAGLYMILMALAMAVGTFIENDYGTSTAQKMIYHAKWFEILHLFFAISLLYNVIKYRLFRKEKVSSFIFHISMIIIILGAAITRYISYEGTMQIQEGNTNNVMMSDISYLQMRFIKGEDAYAQNAHIKLGTYYKNNFDKSYKINEDEFNVRLIDFLPNYSNSAVETDEGPALLHLITTDGDGRISKYLSSGSTTNISGLTFKFFDDEDAESVHIRQDEDGLLWIKSPYIVQRLSMMTQTMDTLNANQYQKFEGRHLHTINGKNIVLKDHFKHGKLLPVSDGFKIERGKKNMLVFEFEHAGVTKTIPLEGGIGIMGSTETFDIGEYKISTTYGPKPIKVPFAIKLEDFKLERYPGSNTPSSYASDVRLIDKEDNVNMPYEIYMNHILNYKGYKFFQSSYTPDEKATILSVNHDYWGTLVTYIGYFLLTFGFLVNLFYGKSRFLILSKKLDKVKEKKKALTFILLMFISTMSFAANPVHTLPDSFKIIDPVLAEAFGQLQIQDNKGRIKPINTYSSEILRKIAYKTSLYDQNADQILLGIVNYPEQWQDVPLIKVNHPKLKQILGITDNWAPFTKFLDKSTLNYVMQKYVEEASKTASGTRGTFDREVIKVDERFNILFTAFTGQLLKLFPMQGDPSKKWFAPTEIVDKDFGEANIFVQNYFKLLHTALDKPKDESYIENAKETINFLNLYQNKLSSDIMLSPTKLAYEIKYNEYNIFARLIGVYAILGILLLIFLFVQLLKPHPLLKWPIYVLTGLLLAAFALHTFNLGLRWYLSERAPWSNGYESLTFIAWATMLSGVVFMKKSKITLAATAILATTILGVAALSWMDPEITNLQPVLKSYWLTIHVSIITASYGFLGLGALLGFFTLLLYIFRNKKNAQRLLLTMKEMTYVNEMTITVGIFLLATGTYLGGVWANESWGRYWGWDSKETWALISIMIYAFVLHMRLIPGLKGMFAFSLASLVSIASIIMTYFGVNYYLSGLHSYATGDPVPIPNYVYYLVTAVFITAVVAHFRNKQFSK